MDVQERISIEEQWLREAEEPTLAAEGGGWRTLLNRKAATRLVNANYGRRDMRGEHFITATAKFMKENPLMKGWDTTGFGNVPESPGNHEVAAEWLDEMFSAGVQRMGGGGGPIRPSTVLKGGQKGFGRCRHKPSRPYTLVHVLLAAFPSWREGNKTKAGQPPGRRGKLIWYEEGACACTGRSAETRDRGGRGDCATGDGPANHREGG